MIAYSHENKYTHHMNKSVFFDQSLHFSFCLEQICTFNVPHSVFIFLSLLLLMLSSFCRGCSTADVCACSLNTHTLTHRGSLSSETSTGMSDSCARPWPPISHWAHYVCLSHTHPPNTCMSHDLKPSAPPHPTPPPDCTHLCMHVHICIHAPIRDHLPKQRHIYRVFCTQT